MFKSAFQSSFLFKAISCAAVSYNNSRTKKTLNKLSYFAGESAVGKRYDKFKERKPYVVYSHYQKLLDKISGFVSGVMNPINVFFNKLVCGSLFAGAYFGFIRNKTDNKLRAVGIFGFYFSVSYVLISVAAGLVRGVGFGWGRGVIPVFIAGIFFFLLALLSGKAVNVFKNSFFIKLIADLLK